MNAESAVDRLIGQSITEAHEDTLVLSDGTRLVFDREDSDCCSWIGLETLRPCPNIITAAFVEDNEHETGWQGDYKAWIRVVTEAGELNVAEADGNASSGYYLHGFALGVRVVEKGVGE